MRIGGFQKVSLIDFPEHIAAIVFTQGCPWRCQFCHNPSLVRPECFSNPIEENVIWDYLKERKGKIDGVVITGGEPTLQPDLLDFIKKIRALGCGYAVKLDTNGAFPDRLKPILDARLVDYIAMDLKADWDHYAEVIGLDSEEGVAGRSPENFSPPVSVAGSVAAAERRSMRDSAEKAPFEGLGWTAVGGGPKESLIANVKRSMEMIRNSGIPYEWRTTVVPQLPIDPVAIGKNLRVGECYFLQSFRKTQTVANPSLTQVPTPSGKGLVLKPLEEMGLEVAWR